MGNQNFNPKMSRIHSSWTLLTQVLISNHSTLTALYLFTSSRPVSVHFQRRCIFVHPAALYLCTSSSAGSLYIQQRWIFLGPATARILETGVQATCVLAPFIHIKNNSAITDPIFWVHWISGPTFFWDQHFFDPKFLGLKKFLEPKFFLSPLFFGR